jgi:hypothetical protein
MAWPTPGAAWLQADTAESLSKTKEMTPKIIPIRSPLMMLTMSMIEPALGIFVPGLALTSLKPSTMAKMPATIPYTQGNQRHNVAAAHANDTRHATTPPMINKIPAVETWLGLYMVSLLALP